MGKNYFYNVSISLVNILFPIITFRYAAHLLGPAGIGKVQFAISFAEYFALFAALGIPVYGMTVTARAGQGKSELAKVFSELISLHAISGALVSAIYFTVIWTVPFFQNDFALYSSAGLIILLGFTSIDWFYFGIEKFKLVALRSVSIKIIAVGFLFIFVKTPGAYLNYLWVLLFTILGNNFISLAFISRHTGLSFKGLGIRKHLKPVLFILGSNVAINMYALWDTIILGFITNDTMVGLYAAGIKLVKFAVPFIISLGASLIPRITQSIHNKNNEDTKDLLGQTFHFVALMAVPISVGLFLLAPELIQVMSGDAFKPAIDVMRILAILPLIIGLGHFFSLQILVPAGLNRQLFFATLIAAICSVALNFTLIPFFNIIGAGISNVLAELLVTALFYFYIRKYFEIQISWGLFIKAICCVWVIIPVTYSFRFVSENAWVIIFGSVLFGGGSYLLLQRFLFKDKLLAGLIQKFYRMIRLEKLAG